MNPLEKRNDLKSKKPDFTRQDAHKKQRLNEGWRRPKGHQSKMRLNRKGYKRCVRIGWGSPKAVYGLNRKGYREITVFNVKDLDQIKDEAALISSGVGRKNKIDIVKACIEKKITIANLKDPQKFLKDIEEEKKQKEAEKKKKEAEKKKAEEKKKEEKQEETLDEITEEKEEMTDEDKKKEEKKEKDKILTKKE